MSTTNPVVHLFEPAHLLDVKDGDHQGAARTSNRHASYVFPTRLIISNAAQKDADRARYKKSMRGSRER